MDQTQCSCVFAMYDREPPNLDGASDPRICFAVHPLWIGALDSLHPFEGQVSVKVRAQLSARPANSVSYRPELGARAMDPRGPFTAER